MGNGHFRKQNADSLSEKFCDAQDQTEVLIHEANNAFLRAAKGRPARSELKSKAESLAKASKEIVRCIPSAGDLHFFLRMAETLSSGESESALKRGLAEAREFDAKTNVVFSNLDDLKVAFEAIEKAARMAIDPPPQDQPHLKVRGRHSGVSSCWPPRRGNKKA